MVDGTWARCGEGDEEGCVGVNEVLTGLRGGVERLVALSGRTPMASCKLSLTPKTFPVTAPRVAAAATCSRSFWRTRVRRFSARSNLLTHSSIEVSSSATVSSCLSIASGLNLAVRGDRRYWQMRAWRFRRPARSLT